MWVSHIGRPNKVCRLRKSLYGLKQSDCSVYIYSNGEVCIIVPIYIDDITLASKSPAAIDKYVQLLSQHFKCRNLGATRFLLGIAVERDRPTCTLKLHKRQFILETLEKYSMSDCKPVQTPLPPKLASIYHIPWLLTHRRTRTSCPKFPISVQLDTPIPCHDDTPWHCALCCLSCSL